MKTFILINIIGTCLVFVLLLGQTSSLRFWISDAIMPIRHGIHRERDIMVPMRDGINLSTDVFLPANKKGPFPVILIRTTYGGTDFYKNKFFVRNGYAVVTQHVRARFNSEGDNYSPHRHSAPDGYDTIDWIVKQKWCSGKIGTFGHSYLGENQTILASAKHPNHITMITNAGGGAIGTVGDSYGYFGLYEDGVLNLATTLGWLTEHGALHRKITQKPDDHDTRITANLMHLPVSSIAEKVVDYKTGYEDFVNHTLTDPWWTEEGYVSRETTYTTSALHTNTWYDQTVHDTFRLAKHMAENAVHPRAKEQYLLIGPGVHSSIDQQPEGSTRVGDLEFGYKNLDFFNIYLSWFDYWLKGSKATLPPRISYFLIHGERWETTKEWPPVKATMHKLYLGPNSSLEESSVSERQTLKNDYGKESYVYDPLDPVPTIGGPICCTGTKPIDGSRDQSPLMDRSDILIYRSAIFQEPVDLIGNIRANLHVSTSATDTDFTVKIVDEYPDGKSYNLQDGVARLRYRNGIENPELATPGEVYQITVGLRPIAYRFRKGHRLAVHISSSNFPRLARNLNTGENEYNGIKAITAKNTVYRNTSYPSFVELPLAAPEQ